MELIVENGRKWALISKFLTGRNEHTVKNRYISILRFLKKKDKKVNPNNFQEVLDAFKQVKLEISSPTRGRKPILKCRNPLLLQVPDEVDEFPLELSPKIEEFLDAQKKEEFFLEATLLSPNLTEIFELSPVKSLAERSSVFNFNSKEIPKPIYTVSKFQNPNPFQKGFGMEEDYFATSNNNSFNRNDRNVNCSFDIESISQKLSSLTFNDHILGDNRNMADQSDNNRFLNPNYSHERSNIFTNGNSMSIEKSIQHLKEKNDPMFDIITENSGKSEIYLANAYEQNVMYDFEWDSGINPERGERSRCKTHKINAFDIQDRLGPMMNAIRKRKSQTFCAPNERFIH